MEYKRGPVRFMILLLIKAYKFFISPVIGNNCRFYPSCSSYIYFAFRYLKIWKAFYLSVHRIIRCNPFCRGGGIDFIKEIPIDLQGDIETKK